MDSAEQAIHSWKTVERFFRNNRVLSEVITFIQEDDKDASFYASSSLQALVISTERSHDLVTKALVLDVESDNLNIRWHENENNYYDFESRKKNLEKFKECFAIFCEQNSAA